MDHQIAWGSEDDDDGDDNGDANDDDNVDEDDDETLHCKGRCMAPLCTTSTLSASPHLCNVFRALTSTSAPSKGLLHPKCK